MSLKLLVNTKKYYSPLLQELDDRISQRHIDLEQAVDADEMRRIQGAIRELRKLKKLRETVNGRKD